MQSVDIFLPGHKVILALEEAHYPLRFHPVVHACDDHWIALSLPEDWHKITNIVPGTKIQLTTVKDECIYSLAAEVKEVNRAKQPSLLVIHKGEIVRIQRRKFYRVDNKTSICLTGLLRPDGEAQADLPAVLTDISAGGIGIKTKLHLPPETKFTVGKMFNSIVSLDEDCTYAFSVRWCQVGQPDGYRAGAAFEFSDPKDQNRIARLINRLQVIRLSRYCHLLGQS
jgi:c-di-GMP-binding flagellar brake protein YcgR